jgi:5-formyltetrahydrofolate cyclo-ligase
MKIDPISIKEALRQESKHIRAGLSEDTRRKASEQICEMVAGWAVFQRCDTVVSYMPMRSEVDLTRLFSQFPEKNWGIPRIQAGGRMVFHVYDAEKLVEHTFGMLEPDPACAPISPQMIQLVLVPGLAFDRRGWRLGYGGGFYDRFLQASPGIPVGVTYQALVRPGIPHQEHDIPMRYLASESGIELV